MSDDQIENTRNDMRLLTPILMMALIVAGGFLYSRSVLCQRVDDPQHSPNWKLRPGTENTGARF